MIAETQLISPEILAKIKMIQFRTKSLVSDFFSGEYLSAFKGRGMEFEEVRPYQPGDDIRAIDWNVTARTGAPYIKIYREEREMTLFFLVDVSASMQFGTVRQFKGELAAEVTALLAYAALQNNDKVGLIIFSDHVEHYLPPRKGRAHVWRVIRDILSHQSRSHRTDLNLPLEFLNRIAKRSAVAFLISDFQGEGYEKTLRQTARHHDLISISLSDPRETQFPKVGLVELEDTETGERLLLDTHRSDILRRWEETMRKERSARERFFQSLKIDHLNLETNSTYVDLLIQFFRRREKK